MSTDQVKTRGRDRDEDMEEVSREQNQMKAIAGGNQATKHI